VPLHELDVALRAYVPAFEQVGHDLPTSQVLLSNIGEARRATGLTWEPATEAQYRVKKLGAGQESFEPVEGLKYVTRGEGGPILGSAKASYHLFRNAELFDIAEAIGAAALEQNRPVTFLRGGEIDGGKRVFLLADLGTRELAGDPSPYVRDMPLLSRHDGSGAVKVLGTNMRWFCTNALRAAEVQAAAGGAAFSFRHTSRIGKRLEDSRKAIAAALLQHDAVQQHTEQLLARAIRPAQASAYLAQFALARVVSKGDPLRQQQAGVSPQRAHAVAAVESQLGRIFASATCEGIRDSAYGPFAAAVEYLDNVREASSADSRFVRTMVAVEPGKTLAFRLARDLL
jgi:phage/plasmid-like protein (TIGR03299 family)